MKRCRLRPQAREDRRDEVRYYRREAGPTAALKLVAEMEQALRQLEGHPAIGSPGIGQLLGIGGLRSWQVKGFPLAFWYLERDDHIDIVRLVGLRQDAWGIDLADA